jgi:hypothetical protein
MSEEERRSDDAVERETAAAAEEAAAIGGRRPAEEPDSPQTPIEEGGGGEAEGFEDAEGALRDRAEHREAGGNPKYDRPDPEADAERAEYGEADQAESNEEASDAPG